MDPAENQRVGRTTGCAGIGSGIPEVLLVVPIRPGSHYAVPALGLLYLATALRRAGHRVGLVDCAKDRLDVAGFVRAAVDARSPVVGIQFHSSDYPFIAQMLPALRRARPDVAIVLGGPHPTCDPANVLREFPEADFAFCGEADTGFPLLVSGLLRGNVRCAEIPGLIWRSTGAPRTNAPVFEEDLDALGFPAWDLMDPRTYGFAPQAVFFRRSPIAPVSTLRGCPCRCSYCTVTNVSGRRLRRRSVGHVLEEFRLLRREYGVSEMHIIDDAFTADRGRVLEFCERLVREKLDIGFTFPNGVRLDTLDRELLLRMKEAGLEFFSVGVESGSDRILKDMRKNLSTAQIEEKLQLVREVGLTANAFFILGYPEETRQDILDTIAFAKRLPLRRAQFSLFKAYPGTEITQRLLDQGRIEAINYRSFSFHKVDVPPRGMTAAELKALQRRAFLEFYLRPGVLFAALCEIRSFRHLNYLVKRVFASLFVSK